MPENPRFPIIRTIYDPAIKDFVFDSGDGKALPNIKEWISSHNPVIYWYILRIDNPTEIDIFQWAIELYTHQALTIVEAYIDGIDRRFEVKKKELDVWNDKYVLSIPKQLGIPIIGRGTRRLYFKIDINCREGLMHQYGISGAFVAHGMGDVEIKEKIFQYSCKVGEFRQIFDKNPDKASDYAKKRLEGKFSSDAVLIFTNSFRMIHELSRYCHSHSVEQDVLLSKLRILQANFDKVPEIAGERILPLIQYEMEKLVTIENKASLTPGIMHLCDSLVELLHVEVAGAEVENTSTSHQKEASERLERDRQRAKQEDGRLRKQHEEQEKKSREEEQKEKHRKDLLKKHYDKGLNAFKSGDWEAAIVAFEQVVNIDHKYQDAAERLSLAAGEKQKEEAETRERETEKARQEEERLRRKREEQERLKREQENRVAKLKEEQQKKEAEKERLHRKREEERQRIEEGQRLKDEEERRRIEGEQRREKSEKYEAFLLKQKNEEEERKARREREGIAEAERREKEKQKKIQEEVRQRRQGEEAAHIQRKKEYEETHIEHEAKLSSRTKLNLIIFLTLVVLLVYLETWNPNSSAVSTPQKTTPSVTAVITLSSDQKTITNSIGMEFVFIPAGEFDMGSPENEKDRYSDEGPVHRVNISKSFYMGKYEVTNKQWSEIMNNNFTLYENDDMPLQQVTWYDVHEFIKKLNEKEGTNKYRLPSEAEWEYAARAGTKTRYFFGDDESIFGPLGSKLGYYAWYDINSDTRDHTVGQKSPNPWGLYDIYGNVEEWVQDTYHDNYTGAPTDGRAWESGGSRFGAGFYRVVRGGCYGSQAKAIRSAERGYTGPYSSDFSNFCTGFRLVRDL